MQNKEGKKGQEEMNEEKISVNAIFTKENSTTGTITSQKLILTHIFDMFGESKSLAMIEKIKAAPSVPFHILTKYHQYIILINYDPFNLDQLRLSMKLTDFHGNIDNALDEYLKLSADKWKSEDMDKIMKLHSEILETNPTRIEMIPVAPRFR